MKKQLTEQELENLIANRLSLQSTQRALTAYGITVPMLKYFKSKQFTDVYNGLAQIQKRNFLHLIAGPYNWRNAEAFLDGIHNF